MIERNIDIINKKLVKEYKKKTENSRKLYTRLSQRIPGGVNYSIRWFSPYPIYIKEAKGTKVIDIDGNEYTDFWMGHGTHILGHSPNIITEALKEAITRGTHPGYANSLLDEYSALLLKAFNKMEMLKLTGSGTEANMYAIRAARAVTKKKKIIKIRGGWHGGTDPLHTGVTPPYKGPESAGLPKELTKYTSSIPYNDPSSLEKALRKRDVAAVVIEPVLGAGGAIEPLPGYLKEVRKLTQDYDSLLIFDEVITGFRILPGGAQTYYNTYPDITILGKIIGGGVPGAGAILGTKEIMKCFDHIIHPSRERCFVGGTFTCNSLTLTAGKEMIRQLLKMKNEYEKAIEKWSIFKKNIEKTCEEHSIKCYATGEGLIIGIHFTKRKPLTSEETIKLRWSETINKAIHLYLRTNNILYLTEQQFHLLPSLVHTDKEIKLLYDKIKEFISKIT